MAFAAPAIAVRPGTKQAPDPRRPAMVASLSNRYAAALARNDAAAKQALFQEGAYLGIKPEEYIDPS